MKKMFLTMIMVGLMVVCGNTAEAKEETGREKSRWHGPNYGKECLYSEEEFNDLIEEALKDIDERNSNANHILGYIISDERTYDDTSDILKSLTYDKNYLYGFNDIEYVFDITDVLVEREGMTRQEQREQISNYVWSNMR